MSRNFVSVKDRIAQSIYVVGGVGSVFASIIFIIDLWFMFDSMQSPYYSNFSRLVDVAVFSFIVTIGSYGAGWGLRWIINGTSTSVIDYIQRK